MEKCIVISVVNQKGGVGKSTTANAIGSGLYHMGHKVLYIDLDPQGNLTFSLGKDVSDISALEVLKQDATIKEAALETPQGDLISAHPNLIMADTIITETGREYRLKEAISLIENEYDFIVIDTPPAIGVLTINALAASDKVIIPAQADIYSLQGVGQLSQTIQTVKKYCNPNIEIEGILITRYNGRSILTKDMTKLLEDTAEKLNTKVFDTKIRECIAIKEAQAKQTDIFTYSKKSNAGKDYKQFINELI